MVNLPLVIYTTRKSKHIIQLIKTKSIFSIFKRRFYLTNYPIFALI